MQKMLSLFLALIWVLAAMPAAFASEPYTLDIYWVGAGDNPEVRAEVEAAINEHIEPLIDAHVSFHIIPWDDWKTDVVDVLLDEDTRKDEKTKMDLVFTADWEYYSDLQEAGALLELDDLLEQEAPETFKSLEGYWDGVKIRKRIYGVPTNKELCVPMGFLVNKTAAEAIGWDFESEEGQITCTADLEPWLQKYKEMFPDKYPYLMDPGSGAMGRWVDEPWINDWSGMEQNALAMKMAKQEDGTFDETVYSIFETPEQEAHIRLMYRWAQAGYIDPEAIHYTDEGHGLFGKGDFLVYTQPLKGNNIKAVEMYTQYHREGDEPYEIAEIILQPKYIVTAHSAGSMFAIPKAGEVDPDRAIQYLNLMHTDAELVNLMLFGVEGKNYTRIDDKKVKLTDTPWYTVHAGAWTVGDVRLQYVLENEDPEKNEKLIAFAEDAEKTSSLGFRFNQKKVRKAEKKAAEAYREELEAALNAIAEANEENAERYAVYGKAALTGLKVLEDPFAAVTAVVKEYGYPLMMGLTDPDDPEKGLESFRQALKDAGIDFLREAAQEQYEDWKNAQK